MTWQWQQFLYIHNQTMHNHIWNVSCVVFLNAHGLIFQVHNHISTIQMLAQPYVFMSINTLHVVLCMTYDLSMKIYSVSSVRFLQMQLLLENFIQENSL